MNMAGRDARHTCIGGKPTAKRERPELAFFRLDVALRLVSRNDSMLDSSGGNHRSIDVH